MGLCANSKQSIVVRLAVGASLLAAAACGGLPRDPGPFPAAMERVGRGAALARVVVENRTALDLRVGYRPTAAPGAPVEIGTVPAGLTALLPPVAAGEPIVLFATTASGARLSLPPRAFEPDSTWTWVIPADARFEAPREQP